MPIDDPMDTPPVRDFGSDRYDYVELSTPPGIRPLGEWWDDLIAEPCQDCRANVFARYVGPAAQGPTTGDREHWHITLAHDTDCPTLSKLEQEGRTGG